MIELHKTAFCSKLAWQAHGEITFLKLDSCSVVLLKFFSCTDVFLEMGAVNLFRVKPCLSGSMVRNLRSLPKHACRSWRRRCNLLPKKLAVPIRMLAVHLSWHLTQCLFSKPKKYKDLSLINSRDYLLSKSWMKSFCCLVWNKASIKVLVERRHFPKAI